MSACLRPEAEAGYDRAMPRASALAFYGFASLVVLDIVLIGWLNPNHDRVIFWVMLVVVFGGLATGALLIGRSLHRGRGFGAAYAYLSVLTGLIVVGAILQSVSGEPNGPQPEGVLQIARLMSGGYLLLMWVVVVWDSSPSRRKGSIGVSG